MTDLGRMSAIWCDDKVHAIMATRESADWLLDSLMDSDGKQEHTWSICPVSVLIEVQ
jgi:hypothetical protein